MINNFEFTQPRDVPEALKALTGKGQIVPVAGGTNVLVNMKRAPLEADLIVDLTRLEALEPISSDKGFIRLGAGVTFAHLLDWSPGGAVESTKAKVFARSYTSDLRQEYSYHAESSQSRRCYNVAGCSRCGRGNL